MIEFVCPWAFLLLPLPYLVHRLFPAALAAEEAALWVPSLQPFVDNRHQRSRRRWPLWLLVPMLFCWLLLVSATAQPQWLGEPLELPVSGRDLVMAVDLSGSMKTADFVLEGETVDRLTALKKVAVEFIRRRQGDRIGLILFADQAYVQTPLTFDRQTVERLLLESVLGLAGEKTAIGDAIGLAVKRLQEAKAKQRILILLTDGANTAGQVSPIKAAELAAREGLKIYTIGIGADEMTVGSFFFKRTVNPSADLDEKSLRAIAEQTGGRYFRARDTAELEQIYLMLDELEPVEKDQEIFRPVTALYHWPLGVALFGALLVGLIDQGRQRWGWR
ncbi:MAG: VWA domain-containing protein [Deltaproteobacteria bacterium]|nr:MAG: VWA domain-containing protein [Deltaproteobacteria bacterium]